MGVLYRVLGINQKHSTRTEEYHEDFSQSRSHGYILEQRMPLKCYSSKCAIQYLDDIGILRTQTNISPVVKMFFLWLVLFDKEVVVRILTRRSSRHSRCWTTSCSVSWLDRVAWSQCFKETFPWSNLFGSEFWYSFAWSNSQLSSDK